MKRLFCILLSFSGVFVWGFIPPLPSILKDTFEGRKPSAATEAVLQHRIHLKSGDVVELEERIFAEKGKMHSSFRGPTLTQPFVLTLDRRSYFVGKEKRLSSRSLIWSKELFATSADEVANVLLSEQFVRREQFTQYRPGFSPSGDPQMWEVKENYIQHDDIFLNRVRGGIGYAILGLNEGSSRRTVVLDKELKGIRRIEWKEGEETVGWNFDHFARFLSPGWYPKRLSFERNGTEAIVSELILHRPLKDKQAVEMRTSLQKSAATVLQTSTEEALQLLLSYR